MRPAVSGSSALLFGGLDNRSSKPLLIIIEINCMSCLQVLLAIIFPPLAVIDRGCGSIMIVFLLTCCGWVPGVIGALVILNKNE